MAPGRDSPLASLGLGDLVELAEQRGLLRTVLPATGSPVATIRISRVTHDSRLVAPGSLFVAVPGARSDGHDYAPDAVRSGAAAVVSERALVGIGVPQLLVHRSRPTLALAAAWLHGFPTHRLGVIGITGTDGKTTTSFRVRAMLEACGLATGLIGTVEVIVGGRSLGNAARATTPEAPELQAHLAAMVAAGDRFVVVESSSHGLAQDRVGEIAYDVAVLTNLTHEHLEFHRTPEAYRAAKLSLFERLAVGPANPVKAWPKTGIVNRDDPAADAFLDAARAAGAAELDYGTDRAARVRAVRVEEDLHSLRLGVRTERWEGDVALRLAGRFNASNALAAIAVGEALALDPARMRAGLESLEGVPGRMQRIDAGQPFVVVVDYAHTAEALAVVLDNLAPAAAAAGGGLIAVFGSAGERDVQKRPQMGRVAAERCRLVILTDEDPRGEDRRRILEQIAVGAERAGKRRDQDLLLVPDRREAIGRALDAARTCDVVLLAGKGHEKTIEIGGREEPWDEVAEARLALAAMGYSRR
ncbi:MAG: UDP-N-acetylmuramoyl-L-alanyl-D-glutamate--2,6-diaminopimelate ligase [Candidatus Limnocylindrales bacterium]